MTQRIVVGVIVVAAACLTERVSAQELVAPPQRITVSSADTVTVVPMATRGGLFQRRRERRGVTTVYYAPVSQQPVMQVSATGMPSTAIQQAMAIEPAQAASMPAGPIVMNSRGRRGVTTVSYPPVAHQQTIVPASARGMPSTGIQQAQAVEPVQAVQPIQAASMPMGTVIVQTPMYTEVQVRQGPLVRLRARFGR
jgi:hypothetical protein